MNFENKLKQALKSNSLEQIYSVFSEIYYFYYRLVYFTIMKNKIFSGKEGGK